MDLKADTMGVAGDIPGYIQLNFGEPEEQITFKEVLTSLVSAGIHVTSDILLLVETALQKISKKPMDDRKMLMERLIQLASKLPEKSFAREKLTSALIDQLWDSLQHPPLSYIGDKYEYRQPDGSHNNIMYPELGKAGTPYARTVRSETKASGARPDPGLLFDCNSKVLMARGDGFRENEAGISSMLFYHAAIITHDVFCTNRKDANISDTSSYLDLAPLYGSSQADQDAIRTFVNGEIKPDTFSERRLLGLPPGVCVMLVMYSRFHNYAARTLAAINEGGRFSHPHNPNDEVAMRKRDNDIFQVARLVTNGLYINISLHDYIRAIANINHTESTWTLDPRVEIDKTFDGEGVPRGVGNQVSCEFNLLYRFHSAISKRDNEWTKEFYARILPGVDPLTVSMPMLLQGINKFEQSIDADPSKRVFGGLARTNDGTFDDADLVKILKESIEDPAGSFGANNVPDILKPVEILGIMQARKWQVASLNEFRAFFNLKRYETFEEINPDPYVSNTLRRLYGEPDKVEMYTRMFLEAAKPRMDPGMGLCAPYSVSRAVFSDAITLVRSDRFLTLDYTPAHLTNWGITEVAQDYQTLGGSKMFHLILNAFPRWFKFNSVYAMQPFYTPTESHKIFTKFGKADLYSFDPPSFDPPPIPIVTHAALKSILSDQKNFKVPWGARMASLEDYMLAADHDTNTAQRALVASALYDVDGATQEFRDFTEQTTWMLLKRGSYGLGRHSVYQVDVVKDIANLVPLHFASALCYLPLKSDADPNGCYSETELYKVLSELTIYVFSDADPTKSWARRRDVRSSIAKLCKIMEEKVAKLKHLRLLISLPVPSPAQGTPPAASHPPLPPPLFPSPGFGFKAPGLSQIAGPAKTATTGALGALPVKLVFGNAHVPPLQDYGINLARKFLDVGKSPKEVASMLVGTACAFVGNTGAAFAQLIDFYLQEENAKHWAEIQRLSRKNTPDSDRTLTKYVLEGARLANSLGIFRNVEPADGTTINIIQGGQTIPVKKGDKVFVSFIAASRDPTAFPDPLEVKVDRPLEAYITFGEGPHQCLGKEINIIHNLTALKILAKLPNLRRTPGDEGKLKFITKPGGIKVYMTPDWSQFTPYPTTMKLLFDGPPQEKKLSTTS